MRLVRAASAVLFLASVAATAFAAPHPTVRATWFETVISPPVGVRIAGYGPHEYSVAKYDDLLAVGLLVDDGTSRVALVSLDLLGLDTDALREIRRRVARVVRTDEACVLVSCTHTHQGPYTTMYKLSNKIGEGGFDETPGSEDMRYMDELYGKVEAAAKQAAEGPWTDCRVGFHSSVVDENRNRRYTTEDNRASFNAHRPILHKLTTGIVDQELVTLSLMTTNNRPAFVLGNWAAHPLTAHAPGRGGVRISSDFPGFYRRYVEEETGAKAMFLQGAAGDVVTKDDELGNAAARRVGEKLGMSSLLSIVSIQRCNSRFTFAKPRVGGVIRNFTSPLREQWRKAYGRTNETFEVQCVAIGDMCFVGVPGEIVTEIGLEIKWNSPFAHACIAYLATGYLGYMTPLNLMAAGGYEAQTQRYRSKDTLLLVKTAQEAMLELRSRLFPEDDEGADPYPDNQNPPVVNLPGMYKGSKMER